MKAEQKDHWQKLFHHKDGRVHLEIWGHRIGWKKRSINFYRWRPSTRVPGSFDKVDWFEPRDLVHLEKCIKQAREWCKSDLVP